MAAIPAHGCGGDSSAGDEALRRLSENLGSLLRTQAFADASVVAATGGEVGVHRCVLASRSTFFSEEFERRGSESRLDLREVLSGFEVGIEALTAVLEYIYTGRVGELPRDACDCADEECLHEGCRPALDFMLQVLYSAFVFHIPEVVRLYQRHLLVILEKVAIDDILVVLLVANLCYASCSRLFNQCLETVAKSDLDTVALEKALPTVIVKEIMELRLIEGLDCSESSNFPNEHVKKLYKALDSDDIQLVEMLLKEGHTDPDDAYLLHYAVAHCDTKIIAAILQQGLADVNHKNLRGHTVLHVAALRREPKIIMSLIEKGARSSELTKDGRTALQISKRLTRSMDYHRPTEERKESCKDAVCVVILEQAERRDFLTGEIPISLQMDRVELHKKLVYYEERVLLASLFFPLEARIAMDIAQVDGTVKFTSEISDETQELFISRLTALAKTVQLGKRFFPRCSAYLNNLLDDDELASQQNNSERRRRLGEISNDLLRALAEDAEDLDRSVWPASSSMSVRRVSSTSVRRVRRKHIS